MNGNRISFGRRRYQTRLKFRTGWPELTALVDILFLALLFFVLASSFVRVSGVSVSLPRVKVQSTAALKRFVISITPPDTEGASCNIYFRDRKISGIDELREQLSNLHDRSDEAKLIIRADRLVPFEMVAQVMAVAEQAKLSTFISVTMPDEKPLTPIEN